MRGGTECRAAETGCRHADGGMSRRATCCRLPRCRSSPPPIGDVHAREQAPRLLWCPGAGSLTRRGQMGFDSPDEPFVISFVVAGVLPPTSGRPIRATPEEVGVTSRLRTQGLAGWVTG